MKFAYLIFTHKNPDQFIRLLRRIDNDDALFYVHIDKKADIEPFKKVEQFIDPKKIVWIKRISIVWAGFNMIRAALSGMRDILNSNETISHVTLLSGQDYPIKPIAEYQKHLLNNYGKDYIETFKLPRPNWQNGGKDRYLYYHIIFPKFRIAWPFFSYVNTKLRFKPKGHYDFLRSLHRFMPRFKDFPRKFIAGATPYEGSQWWTLSMNSVKNILNSIDKNSTYYDYFKYTHVSDEMFFNTVIKNCHINTEDNIISNNLRYIDWSEDTTGHPRTFEDEDFDAIVNSGAFFARKFEPDTSILDIIDNKLLNK